MSTLSLYMCPWLCALEDRKSQKESFCSTCFLFNIYLGCWSNEQIFIKPTIVRCSVYKKNNKNTLLEYGVWWLKKGTIHGMKKKKTKKSTLKRWHLKWRARSWIPASLYICMERAKWSCPELSIPKLDY